MDYANNGRWAIRIYLCSVAVRVKPLSAARDALGLNHRVATLLGHGNHVSAVLTGVTICGAVEKRWNLQTQTSK